MKRIKGIIVLVLLLMLVASPIAVLASDVSSARYYGTIIVTNNSTATTNVAVNCTISTQALIDGNYLNSSANNCAIQSSGGADLPFMPAPNDTYPWAFWVPSIGNLSHLSDILYTANSIGGEIRYFPGAGGMTTPDNQPMEIADNFSIEQSLWVDTSGFSPPLVHKPDAYRTYVSGTENITSAIGLGSNLSHAANDHCVKAAGVVMPSGSTMTVEAWVYFDGLGAAHTCVSCGDTGAGQYWYLHKNAANKILFNLTDVTGAAMAATWTSDVVVAATTWYLITATYDANRATETAVYINGTEWTGVDGGTGLDIWQSNIQMVTAAHWNGAGYIVDLVGDLDEIRVSSSCRTLAEHIASYNGGDGVPFENDADTISLWHFDEGAGNPADIAGNNDLVNTGAAWVNTTPVPGGEAAFVTAGGYPSGEYVIRTTANTTHMWIDVDGVTQDTVALGATTVPDNANDWAFVPNLVVPYMAYQWFTVNSTQVQYIDWEYDDTTFTDNSTFGNDATPTFFTDTTDPDVTATLSNFQPVLEAQAPSYVLSEAPAFIDADALTGNVTAPFTVIPPAAEFPLAGPIAAIAAATATPPQLPLLLIAAFIILAASLTVSATMRKYGSGSLIVKTVTITAVMGCFVAVRNFGIDFWMIYVFLAIAVAIMMASRHTTWQ